MNPKAMEADERISCILANVAGTAILDVGCVGRGFPHPQGAKGESHAMHLQLSRRFPTCEITGIDKNSSAVEQMNQHGFHAVVGNAESFNLNSQFDTIVAGELIEHVSNPGLFLEECRRHLKPGGRVVLSTPNAFSPMYFLMYLKDFAEAFNTDHSCWFCPQTIRQIADRYRFAIREMRFVDDLAPEIVAGFWYKVYAHFWKIVRVVLPVRLRNCMVLVLQPIQEPSASE